MSSLPALGADGRGGLTLGGARYLLIRPETLVELQKAVEGVLGERAAACIAAGGRAGGTRATASLDGTAEERVARLLRIGGEIGWGEFALERLTTAELVVSVRHSAVAESYGAATAPVCHLIRGVLESLAGTPEERVARLLRSGGEIGWGEFALERLTAAELVVSVHHSAVAESYGPASAPVCHLICGVLESLAAATFGRPSTVVETACVAMGAPACRFVAS